MGSVLVLDANSLQGLAAIRNLGSHGLAVTAGSHERFDAGSLSKYTSHRLRYPSPTEETEEFLRTVERELMSREYDMLLPCHQSTVEIVVRNRDRFEPHAVLPFTDTETLDAGLDKAATVVAARKAGVAHPKSIVSEVTDFERAGDELGYPVVVKPRRGTNRGGMSICHSAAELGRVYRETRDRYGPLVLQEFVPFGGERGVYTMFGDDTEMLRVVVQRRLRSYPPEGGASTYRETVHDPELVAEADRLLSAMGWWGVAMVEFRIDERTGEPLLMEINPRFWGSLALSVFAGVDFPFDLYRLAMGESVESDLDYRVPVRARCLFKDAQQVVAREDRVTAAREFFQRSPVPSTFDIISWSDPLPTAGQLLYYAGRVHRRLRGRFRRTKPPVIPGEYDTSAETNQ